MPVNSSTSSRASKSLKRIAPARIAPARIQAVIAIACTLSLIACNSAGRTPTPDTQRPSDEEIAKRLLRISEAALAAKTNTPQAALPWAQLGALLPDKLGKLNAKAPAQGINDTNVTKVARASRIYSTDSEEVTIEIVDAIGSGALVLAFLVQQASIAKQPATDGVTVKSINVGTNPAIVRHDIATKTARVSIAVGGRFIVDLSAIPTEDAENTLRIAGALPLDALAKLVAQAQVDDEAVEPSAPTEAPAPTPRAAPVDIDDPDQP